MFSLVATSRSGSPSSRLAYMYNRNNVDHESPRPRRMSSGIPRSTTGSRDASRETSPSRDSSINRFRSRGAVCDRPPLSPASRPVMAQKILQQSREAESALADALVSSILMCSVLWINAVVFYQLMASVWFIKPVRCRTWFICSIRKKTIFNINSWVDLRWQEIVSMMTQLHCCMKQGIGYFLCQNVLMRDIFCLLLYIIVLYCFSEIWPRGYRRWSLQTK